LTAQFHAELRGHFIGNDLSFLKVQSLHEGIINFLNLKTGYLVSFIQKQSNMTGMSLLVPSLFENDIKLPRPGQIIRQRNEEDFFLDSKLLSYINTPLWSGYASAEKKILSERLKELYEMKMNIDEGESLFALFKDSCRNPYQLKVKKILENHILLKNGQIEGLEKLIGLGQGMTPSGDDFITGAFLGQNLFTGSSILCQKNIKKNLERTTTAGKTLLFLAIQNSFPAYLLNFIKEICVPEKDIKTASLKAAEHGATSGLDSLTGLLWYFKYFQKETGL
jgi:hypothetical protein